MAVTPSSLVPIMIHHTGESLEWIVQNIVEQLYDSARCFDEGGG